MGNAPSTPETKVTQEVKGLQKMVSDTLISNEVDTGTNVTVDQIMENMTFDGINCTGCTEGIDLSQDANVTVTVDANIDSLVDASFINKFKQKSDQMIDAMIDEQREFMSPENKRKTELAMKSDMDQIVENTFTATNLMNIVTAF